MMKAKELPNEGELLPCSSVRDASVGTDDSDGSRAAIGKLG